MKNKKNIDGNLYLMAGFLFLLAGFMQQAMPFYVIGCCMFIMAIQKFKKR